MQTVERSLTMRAVSEMVAALTIFDDGNRIDCELVVVLQGAAH